MKTGGRGQRLSWGRVLGESLLMLLVWTGVHLSGLLLCRIDFDRFVGLVSVVEVHTKHLVLGLDLVVAALLGVGLVVAGRYLMHESSPPGLWSVVFPLMISGLLAIGMIYFPAYLASGQLPVGSFLWGKGPWPSVAYAALVLTFLWLARLALGRKKTRR